MKIQRLDDVRGEKILGKESWNKIRNSMRKRVLVLFLGFLSRQLNIVFRKLYLSEFLIEKKKREKEAE